MISKLPLTERPRERCISQGAHCLSLRECIAVILGSGPRNLGALGVASQILDLPGIGLEPIEQERAFFTAMEVSNLTHLAEVRGLGPSGRARILAAFELGRRYSVFRQQTGTERPLPAKLRAADLRKQAVAKISMDRRTDPQERLAFVPIYKGGQVGQFCLVEKGVRTHVNIDPLELFSRLLALRPHHFILFHNHPSGDLTPSAADFELTLNVQELADKFGIRLLGHGIVSGQSDNWIDL